jgi:phosphoribosylaminoimidazolecarboxamide formyltransferase/IMP cyclohydrolase
VILAPAVSDKARSILESKKNLRVVTLDWPKASSEGLEWRHLLGGWLAQDRDRLSAEEQQPKTATRRSPTAREMSDLLFAWKAVKHAKSNAIVLALGDATVGIGQGQPSRVGSVRIAVEKAGERARGAVAASDAFFPFADAVTALAQAGVTAVIQPGGSLRDAEVIAAADSAGMAMVLTGVRHFRH